MNIIYSDNKDHQPINLDYVIYMYVDGDGVNFKLKDNDEKIWEYEKKKEAYEMLQKILDHAGATNMSTQIKL